MRTRTLLVLLIIVMIGAFTVINWPAVTAPTVLSMGFATFEAPLGLVMLGLFVALTVTFAIHMALWQGTILLEARRHTKELQSQRSLADQAEASRFTELRGLMQAEFEKMTGHIALTHEALRAEIRESSNSLAAMMGEIDDRMKPQQNREQG